MRTSGAPIILEYRRRLAVQRVDEGYSIGEVADFLGVDPSSVRRWVAIFRQQGADSLAARPVPGRPPKLDSTQEKFIGRWLADNPLAHGCTTELWTAGDLTRLIEQEWGIRLNPDYLTTWRRRRGFTPQKPRPKARERDDEAIARWLEKDWPRIKKGAAAGREPAADG
jgi:transposase